MATLVKFRGLERGDSAVASGTSMSAGDRGFRIRSGYGLQYPAGVKATSSGGAGTSKVIVTAKYGGTWANNHVFTYASGGSAGAISIAVALAATTGVPTITYTCGSGVTAAQVVAALNIDPFVSQLYTASLDSSGAGTTLVSAGTLASGTDSGTGQAIYVTVNNKTTQVVNIDDAHAARTLRRNYNRYVSLGLGAA